MRIFTSLLLLCALMLGTQQASAQFSLNETFESYAASTAWTGGGAWTITNGDPDATEITTSQVCSGSGGIKSFRTNLWSSFTACTLTSPVLTASTGTKVTVKYSYKIVDWSAGTVGTVDNWGSITAQYSVNAGTWTNITAGASPNLNPVTATNGAHTVSTTCATKTYTISAATVPVGATLQIRLVMSSPTATLFGYWFYFDDVQATQAATTVPACIAAPTLPANGTTGLCNTGITLSWPSVAGATSYDIYYGTPTIGALVANQAGTTYALPTLTAGATYQWKIVPKNAIGSATGCSTWTFNTNVAAPTTQASNVVISSVATATATVGWTNGNGPGRLVLLNTSNSFTSIPNGALPTANSVYGGAGQQVMYAGTGTSVAISGLTGATTYYAKVVEYYQCGSTYYFNNTAATNNPNSFTTAIAVSNNDLLCNAVTATTGIAYSGTTVGATNDNMTTLCDVATAQTAPGVWFKFVGTGQSIFASLCGSSYDTKISVYCEGSAFNCSTPSTANSLLCHGGNDDACGLQSQVSFLSGVGINYYILVHGYSTNTGSYGLSLTGSTAATPPANDDCEDPGVGCRTYGAATPITVGEDCSSPTAANNTNANTGANPSCDAFGVIKDVWFSFVAPPSGVANIRITLGTAIGVKVGIREGSCSATPFGCLSTLTYTAGVANVAVTGLTSGTTYYLQTWTNTSATSNVGTYTVCIFDQCSPTIADYAPNGQNTYVNPTNLCDAASGWTYYGTNFGKFFAIKWGAANAAAKAAASVVLNNITSDNIPYSAINGTTQAAYLMNTYWNVEGASTLAAPVDIRWYFDPAKKTAVQNAANTYASNNGKVASGFLWFKTVGTTFSPTSLTPAGVVTALDPATGLPAHIYLTGTIGTESNGKTYVEFDGITSFSGGTGGILVGNGRGILPIELKSFNGRIAGSMNHLQWATGTEKNVQWHILERSADGTSNWKEIGRVAGQMNSLSEMNYNMDDQAPIAKAFYRLRVVDFDRAEQLSNVVSLNRKAGQFGIENAFPVPTSSQLSVQYTALEEGKVTLRLTDLAGRIVFEQKVSATKGLNTEQLDIFSLQSGYYLLTVHNGTSVSESFRVVKQ